MAIELTQLVSHLDELLSSKEIKDYAPNGLQVEGKSSIAKIVTGVTASEALIDAAIQSNADAILVHHGYFWKGESQVITGMKRNRIKKLLQHDISLLAYHLPVDVHENLGNNAQLGKLLEITDIEPMAGVFPNGIIQQGKLSKSIKASEFAKLLKVKLQREPLMCSNNDKDIETIAWCTGGGQSYIDEAASRGIDAFLTGEASEQTIHSAREQDIVFYAAGHHATERYGIKAVGEQLAQQFELQVQFIDIHNPV